MTTANVMKKISEEPTKKNAVIDVLKVLNGESYPYAKDVLEIALYFLSLNCMLDSDMAQDVINAVEIAGE